MGLPGMTMRAIAILFGLMLAALASADVAHAQIAVGGSSLFIPSFRIQCAGASELCAWKRIPGSRRFEGFEPMRPMRDSRPPQKPSTRPF
jgi:hypothetical protein